MAINKKANCYHQFCYCYLMLWPDNLKYIIMYQHVCWLIFFFYYKYMFQSHNMNLPQSWPMTKISKTNWSQSENAKLVGIICDYSVTHRCKAAIEQSKEGVMSTPSVKSHLQMSPHLLLLLNPTRDKCKGLQKICFSLERREGIDGHVAVFVTKVFSGTGLLVQCPTPNQEGQ